MLPSRVLNPGPLTYKSGALPIALRGPAYLKVTFMSKNIYFQFLFTVKLRLSQATGNSKKIFWDQKIYFETSVV